MRFGFDNIVVIGGFVLDVVLCRKAARSRSARMKASLIAHAAGIATAIATVVATTLGPRPHRSCQDTIMIPT